MSLKKKDNKDIGVQQFLDILDCNVLSLEEKSSQLKNIYYQLNQEGKAYIWKIPFFEKTKQIKSEMLLSFLKEDPEFKEDEVIFFNTYIQTMSVTTVIYRATEWFLENSSKKWLLKNTEMIPFICRCFLTNISVTNTYVKVKNAFAKKIATLTEEEYQLFIESNIKDKDEIIDNYSLFLFGYGSREKVKHIHDLFLNNLSEKTKNNIGFALILRNDISLINQYKKVVIDALNEKICTYSDYEKIGAVLNVELLEFFYENFNSLKENKYKKMMAHVIAKGLYTFCLKNKNKNIFDRSILDVVLEQDIKSPEKSIPNTMMYLLWRIVQNFRKEEKDFFVDKVLKHTKETGEYENVKKRLLLGDNSNITFCGVKLDMQNAALRLYFKDFLYNELKENLDIKPIAKRNKI